MISLTRRLALGLLIAGFAIMFLLAHGSVLLFDQAFRDYLGDRLQDAAEGVIAEAVNDKGVVDLDILPYLDAYNRVYSGSYFRIQVDSGVEVRSRSLWDTRLPQVDYGLSKHLYRGPESQKLLVWRGKFIRHGHVFDVTTALDYASVTARLNWLRMSIWLLGGLLALLLVVIQQQVIRLVLRPLGRVREELTQLNDGDRMKIETRVPEEIAPVVSELNHQLERIERVLQRSKDGISNLGHALKTPIAVMETLIARKDLDAHPRLREALHARLGEIHQLVERELQRARLDTRDTSPKARFKPDTELPALISTLGEIYPHIHFDYSIDNVSSALPWEDEDMLEVLGNLLDNAGKWAHSRVNLHLAEQSFAQQGKVLLIEIDDDGPGIPPSKRDDALNRGTRLDERVAGHGLGLGIVGQVVNYHHGQLSLGDSPMGGLKVTISLPFSPPPRRQPDEK